MRYGARLTACISAMDVGSVWTGKESFGVGQSVLAVGRNKRKPSSEQARLEQGEFLILGGRARAGRAYPARAWVITWAITATLLIWLLASSLSCSPVVLFRALERGPLARLPRHCCCHLSPLASLRDGARGGQSRDDAAAPSWPRPAPARPAVSAARSLDAVQPRRRRGGQQPAGQQLVRAQAGGRRQPVGRDPLHQGAAAGTRQEPRAALSQHKRAVAML
jgi:hypothetical protein